MGKALSIWVMPNTIPPRIYYNRPNVDPLSTQLVDPQLNMLSSNALNGATRHPQSFSVELGSNNYA